MANIYNSQLDAYSLYHQQKENVHPSPTIGPALPALGHALSGSTGTAISNLSIYPLSLIITRLQVQRSLRVESNTPHPGEYKGVIDAFIKIYEQEGIQGFYTGVLQDTGKSIADSFLFFLFYNYMRERRIVGNGGMAGVKGQSLPAFDELVVGAVAGACSKFFTSPISNIVTRKQTASILSLRSASSSTKTTSPSVSQIVKQIREEKGIQGFWSGYSASLVLTLNPSLTFFLYEFSKRNLLPKSRRDDPGARVTFLMAAVSKAIASLATYPFALAKSRAQASSSPPVPAETASSLKTSTQGLDSKEDAEKVSKQAGRVAKRSTVFATILKIWREEGPAVLYEGVGAEICKGFFSHGITMLVKEAVHKTIIRLYFLLLKLLGRMPSAGDMAVQASEAAQNTGGKAGRMVTDLRGLANEVVSDSGEKIQEGYVSVSQTVSDLGERAGVVSSNASEAVKKADVLASEEVGHVLGIAHETLGGKIEGVKNDD